MSHTYTMEDWQEALDNNDKIKLHKIIETTSEECGKPNSYCLTEVFCPECPWGLLNVQRSKVGVKK